MAEPRQEPKSAYIGLTSTEIRSTLTTITGIHTLLLETTLTAEQRAYIASAQEATNGVLSLVNDLADFSLIEAGEFSFDTIRFDLRTAIEEAMESIARKSADRTSEIHTLIHASVPDLVFGDPARIRRILSTLVETAGAFAPAGEIVLSVKTVEEEGDRIVVRFDINESGVGLTGEQLDNLMRSFSNPADVATLQYGRTGVGLALVKRLAQLMGGQIGLSNTGGRGSTFWFSIGLTKCPDQQRADDDYRQSLDGMKVLVVDPGTTGRSILIQYLGLAGCTCKSYGHWEELLDDAGAGRIAAETFDAVILSMPEVGEDGNRTAARLRAFAPLTHLPMVLITAIGQRGDARMLQNLGVAAYLTRPLKQRQLVECLRLLRYGGKKDAAAGKNSGMRSLITRHTIAESDANRKVRILLADDNAANRKKVRKMISAAGFGCDVAENGVDAVGSFGRKSYNLILMDCEMPILNGYDATRIIRKEETARGSTIPIPVCGMIAGGGGDETARCREAGMDDTITKPLSPEPLLALLKKWVRSSPS